MSELTPPDYIEEAYMLSLALEGQNMRAKRRVIRKVLEDAWRNGYGRRKNVERVYVTRYDGTIAPG